jgi:hypothetical protein
VNPARFTNGTHGLSSNDPGTWASWHQKNASSAVMAPDGMWDGAVGHRDVNHVSHRLLLGLGDARRYFIRLSVAIANAPLTIAYDDQGSERKTPAPFDHRCASLDLEHPINQITLLCAGLSSL